MTDEKGSNDELVAEAMAASVASPPAPAGDRASRTVVGAVRVRGRLLGVAAAVAIAAIAFVVVTTGSLAGFGGHGQAGSPASSPSISPAPSVPGASSATSSGDNGYAERLERALAGLPVGNPPAYDMIIGSRLYRVGGGQLEVPAPPGMLVESATPASGGWLVTYGAVADRRHRVTLVTTDGAATDLGDGPLASVAVTPDRTRAAVLVSDGLHMHATVVELPSGRQVARTDLPGGNPADGVLRAVGWSDGAVVLSATSSDPSPTWADVWDPSRGPYEIDPAQDQAFRFLGRYGSGGEMLAIAYAGQDNCLVVVHPAHDFAIRAQRCGLGELLLSASPDGRRLFRPEDDGPRRTWQTLDTAAALAGSTAWVTLGAPAGTDQPQEWSENPSSVLVAVAVPGPGESVPPERWLDMVRCPADGGGCQRVPVPASAPGERAVLVYPY